MDNSLNKRDVRRVKRALRVRKHIRGTSEQPRMNVLRSNKHLTVQLIDDENHVTVASYGTMSKQLRDKNLGKKSKEAARAIGQKIAQLAKEKNIHRVTFDRGWYRYHGLIAELANAARETGLHF